MDYLADLLFKMQFSLTEGAAAPAAGTMLYVYIIIASIFILDLYIFLVMMPVSLWIEARKAGLLISLVDLASMRFAGLDQKKMIALIKKASNEGLILEVFPLIMHHKAGGNTENVVNALIYAKQENFRITLEKACILDLSGKDVIESIKDGCLGIEKIEL
jgi:uncharacterized protein YqfA (UPF0365 family)